MAALTTPALMLAQSYSAALFTYPSQFQASYPLPNSLIGGASQAIYRWTGAEWEKIKVSVWNGTTWNLI